MFRVWYSTETFADFVIENTELRNHNPVKSKLYESDANSPRNFHRIPDHVKNILYLDSPDLIVEHEGDPLFSIEISQEAGTGHNAFQRFPRIAASVESKVPTFYVYPEAAFIRRSGDESGGRWDRINPLIFGALESMMQIYDIPALLFYFPSEYPSQPPSTNKGLLFDGRFPGQPRRNNTEMEALFDLINSLLDLTLKGKRAEWVKLRSVRDRRDWMQSEFVKKNGQGRTWSPMTAVTEVPTEKVIKYFRQYSKDCNPEIFTGRKNTLVYQVDSKFRGDPYPGALAAIDYLKCRTGETYEDRDKNLVLCWGKLRETGGELRVVSSNPIRNSVNSFFNKVQQVVSLSGRTLLSSNFSDLRGEQIPRYYMQVRHGTAFTQSKEIRCYAYFADGIMFHDGALWREG